MSTAIWGEQESQPDQHVSMPLLKHLLLQMMGQFGCTGAVIALHDEKIEQMEVRLHLRLRNNSSMISGASRGGGGSTDSMNVLDRHITVNLGDPSSPAIGRLKRPSQTLALDEVEEVTAQQSDLFPVGTCYRLGQDLIGYVWSQNETHIMRHEDYLSFFYTGDVTTLKVNVVPTWYLIVPMQEPTLVDEARGKKKQPMVTGVIILYQTTAGAVFQQKQRSEAREFAERIALHLQNEQLRLRQTRTSDYLKRLQSITAAFPSTLTLAKLVEDVYQFAAKVVDVSSMLITLYDRDSKKIYDVFAVQNESHVEGLAEQPRVIDPEDRPVWWRVTQEEKQTLPIDLTHYEQGDFDELLTGVWGDQRKAGSFLLLPMKMFNRVTGSLSITSMHPNAYRAEEIQVLETMVQIVTVNIENAKLYDHSHKALSDASKREEMLAAMNSALQTISVSTALNVNDILHKFVESAAKLVQTEMSIFFQCTDEQEHVIVQAAYEAPKQQISSPDLDIQAISAQSQAANPFTAFRASSASASTSSQAAWKESEEKHTELFEKIHIPFKGSSLEYQVGMGFFYLDEAMAEELAKECDEWGAIFLLETGIKKMLMVPVLYQAELVGILGVHTPEQARKFRPTEIGMLLALSAQAASAIRNAQLFEEIQEAYAEQQQLDKLKDEFLVTASHELRTPLSAISGYSSLLKRHSSRIDPQQIARYATKIAGATQQLTDLVNSMTEAAKIGTVDKKLDLQIGPVQMHAAVEMAANMLSVNIEQKIMTQVGADLWVSGDPLRVRQVLSNLLDNAAKYSPTDGRIEVIAGTTILSKVDLPEEQYDVEVSRHLPVVLVQVHDEGEGVEAEDQQKIFEKFVRASRSLTTPVRGSGLGLFICRRYIEAMGGRLWLQQSSPGEGSVFSFYLPRMDAPVNMGKDEEDAAEGQ
ncbi:MAG TPA: ATP-binding protein [Ktedonobacteraceae bacterium]|nr:ATP-binding protein [Ktedonobacteraceae bacterium]